MLLPEHSQTLMRGDIGLVVRCINAADGTLAQGSHYVIHYMIVL